MIKEFSTNHLGWWESYVPFPPPRKNNTKEKTIFKGNEDTRIRSILFAVLTY